MTSRLPITTSSHGKMAAMSLVLQAGRNGSARSDVRKDGCDMSLFTPEKMKRAPTLRANRRRNIMPIAVSRSTTECNQDWASVEAASGQGSSDLTSPVLLNAAHEYGKCLVAAQMLLIHQPATTSNNHNTSVARSLGSGKVAVSAVEIRNIACGFPHLSSPG